ncbi:nucleoside monophosphate kinase [Candidatus Saccharibacteria bacterium]|nr:nucleoside monophosphate kinase [Candidatus Saccharibacteria bacterium]
MIILFGAAGSGKSLQGRKLSEDYGWRWLSVGQLLREKQDQILVQQMRAGGLVDDEYVVKMMHEAIMEAEQAEVEAVLDGYPRDEWQAQWLVEHGDSAKIDGAIILQVSEEELWRRLEERGREDDTKEAIERRWEIFRATIAKMQQILEGAGVKFAEINGEGTVEEVAERIRAALHGWGVVQKREEE